jgi:mono/diheme cytochrome c family protein
MAYFKVPIFSILLAGFILLVSVQCEPDRYAQGRRLYTVHCAFCHMDDGTGLKGAIPPLKNADYLRARKKNLPCLIRHGVQGTIEVNGISYSENMQGIKGLDEASIANITNYVLKEFLKEEKMYNYIEIKKVLDGCR